MKKILIGLLSASVVIFATICLSMGRDNLTLVATQTISLTSNDATTSSVVQDPNDKIRISERCVGTARSLDIAPDGNIVLQDQTTSMVGLFDLKTREKTLFEEAVFVMAVSPDNKQLAYSDEKTGQLVILSSNGEKESMISVPKDWIGVVNWITSNTVLIEKFIGDPFRLASSVIYHLETGKAEEYPSDYPGITTAFPPHRWGNYSYVRTVYDPFFSRVVYPGADEHGEPLLVLWDLEANREIVKFHQGYDNFVGGAPQWTRDGLAFISGIYPQHLAGDTLYKNVPDDLPYMGGYELFHVGRDGNIQRLTYLTTEYRAGEEAFSLSPDEKHIAFWLNLNYEPGDQNADRKLAVLDIATGEITNLCLSSEATPIDPIWSPDGKYLVVSRYYTTGDVLSDITLIDLEHNQAVKIADNATAKGWLVK